MRVLISAGHVAAALIVDANSLFFSFFLKKKSHLQYMPISHESEPAGLCGNI